jgi:A/G-specific adenine glycosylase
LQAGAARVATEHGGVVPDTWEAVKALPGVGDYTAGAILSIAYGVAVPAVDGNVMSVLSRVYLIEDDITKPATKRAIEVRARALLPAPGAESPVRPGDVNEALMELGATVCVPVRPRCDTCPIAGFCRARAEGAQDRLPVKAKKAKARAVTLAVAIVERDGKLLVAPRGEDGIWAGLWAFPTAEALADEPSADAIARALTALGIAGEVGPVTQTVSHTLTHRQLTLPVHRVSWRSGEVPFGAGTWVAPDDLGHYPLPVPMQKIARSLDYGPLFRLRSEPS